MTRAGTLNMAEAKADWIAAVDTVEDAAVFWRKRWQAASSVSNKLPLFEEVAIGSLGRYADGTALVQMGSDDVVLLRSSDRFSAWLYGSDRVSGGLPRPDVDRYLRQAASSALSTLRPVTVPTATVREGEVQVNSLLALPLRSRWGDDVVLTVVTGPARRYGLAERVYRSTSEGLVALAPIAGADGSVTDLQIVAANEGAARLLRREAGDLMWATLSSLATDLPTRAVVDLLIASAETAGQADFELELFPTAAPTHLKGSASVVDGLVLVTLLDVTEIKVRDAGFRSMFASNPVPMWLADAGTLRVIAVNDAAVEHYGYPRERFLAMTQFDLMPPDEREVLRDLVHNRQQQPYYHGERKWRHLRADGSEIVVLPYARPLTIAGREATLVGCVDLTAEQAAVDALRSTRAFLDTIVEAIPSAVFVKDAEEQRFLLVNRAAEDILGLPRAEVLGRTTFELFAGAPDGAAFGHDARARTAMPGSPVVEEHSQSPRSGETRLLSVKKLAVPASEGAPGYLLGIAEDVTERRAIEARVAHMAHHDGLTDLPNRTLLRERLGMALARRRRRGGLVAVIFLDLDEFKVVNDTLGHLTGDVLLKGIAERLGRCVREEDTVARFGGDEFAVLLPEPGSADDVGALAARLIASVSRPMIVQGQELRVGASVGIALAPTDGDDDESLLRHADLALYRAKAEGKGTHRFFEPEMNARIVARRTMEHDLRNALRRGEFELHYQPLLNLANGRVSACEALLRWRHPQRGLVPPGDFIPLAEETGIIGPIGEWVIREACSEAARWPDDVRVAVNVSPVQFRGGGLVPIVTSALAAAGLTPSRLEVEITETVLLNDSESNLAVLHQLRGLGVRIAMDDFGIGYSSLSYLRTFPFDKMKIDRSFVREIGDNRHCKAIVRAVAALGASLGITTVAEGVETTDQLSQVEGEGCSEVQGFLYSRPLPAAEVRWFLSKAGQTTCAA